MLLLPAHICNQTRGDQRARGRKASRCGPGLSAQVGICVKAAAPANSYIFLRAGLIGETLDVYKGHVAADSKHSFMASVSPLGRKGICSHPRKGEQSDPLRSHGAPQSTSSEWVPAAAGTPGCVDSQMKGHPTGLGAAKGMWQLALGSGNSRASRTWKSTGQGGAGI